MIHADRQATIWFIRGHAERRRQYEAERKRIMLRDGGTETNGIALAEYSESRLGEKVRVIESALNTVAADIVSDKLREAVKRAVMLNVCQTRSYSYERLNLPGISRNRFYRYRREFIIAVYEMREAR